MGAGLKAPRDAYHLPDALRPAFARAWGPVVDTATLGVMLRPDDIVMAVGDVVSVTLKELGIKPKLFVCDYKTQRGVDDTEYRRILGAWGDRETKVRNPAGQLTREAWDAVTDALGRKGTTRIVVDGEEDLLGAPCVLEGPDDAFMLYGMPGQGIVVCRATPEMRQKVTDLVSQMD